ncbi:MAG: hypothetical protein WC780_14415 [Lentimicrobiaceae bacterium]|jgi:hypothetical protein
MKKILFILILTVSVSSLIQSQTVTKTKYSSPKTTNLQPIPVEIQTPSPPPAPAPKSNKTESAVQKSEVATSVYSLTSVKVNIRTGNDNKEYPSGARVSLGVRGSNNEYAYFVQENLKNEMKSNSNTEFGLEKKTGNLKDLTLDVLQNAGFNLRISYSANFQFDAWKIEGVSVTLEFRDQNGNLNPTLAQKVITFSNANGFLNGYDGTRNMICNTDGYFNPLSAYIE